MIPPKIILCLFPWKQWNGFSSEIDRQKGRFSSSRIWCFSLSMFPVTVSDLLSHPWSQSLLFCNMKMNDFIIVSLSGDMILLPNFRLWNLFWGRQPWLKTEGRSGRKGELVSFLYPLLTFSLLHHAWTFSSVSRPSDKKVYPKKCPVSVKPSCIMDMTDEGNVLWFTKKERWEEKKS